MEKPYLNDTGLNALIQQLSNKIKSHTSGSITDTNGVLDNPNNFATILAIVDYVKNITDNGIIVPITETIMALTTEVGKYYRIDVPVETLAVTLPAVGVVTSVKTVVIYLTGGTTPDVTITAADNKRVVFQDDYEINSGMTYEIKCTYNGAAWIVTAVEIFIPEPMNIITYEASAKLVETTETSTGGLHTNAFSGTSGQLTITKHTFENGVGTITFNGDVTSIGQRAFYACTGLTSINIPSSVISIDNYAFYSCSGLTSVTIPDSVTSIGNSAFDACRSLTSITIPDSVTSIGGSAFYECIGLTSVTIGSGVTSIGIQVFSNCTGLTSVTIGSGVTSIGIAAFNNCSSLTSITIPDSVTSIGSSAFNGCDELTSVIIGSGVISIGDYAFNNCSSLTSITSNATTAPTIQNSTFQNVKTGGTLYVPSGSTGYNVWMQNANYYLGLYGWRMVPMNIITYEATAKLEETTSQYSIGLHTNAFGGKNGRLTITSHTFENGVGTIEFNGDVTSIGKMAFYKCTGLISITIPNSVTSIGDGAFRDCTGLTNLNIPSGVTSISNEAFRSCSGLTSITCNAMTAPTIKSDTFQNVKTGGTLTVPSGSTGYDVWMGTGYYYLGMYNWTKIEQ